MCLHIFFLSIVLGTKVPNNFRAKFWVAFYAMQNYYKLFVWHNHQKTEKVTTKQERARMLDD